MQEYLSLPAGNYTFQAQATDLAGNVESTKATGTNSKSWGPFVLPSPYAIITGVLATENAHCLSQGCEVKVGGVGALAS